MTTVIAGILVLIVGAIATAADAPARFAGEWKSTSGPVLFEEDGEDVTGKIVAFKLPLKGKTSDNGRSLTVSYVENRLKVDGILKMESSGNAFTGTCKSSDGRQWVWSGWRSDPSALEGDPADFSGLWLTDLGLMELTADGAKINGQYALRGTSSLRGSVKGRYFEFKIKSGNFTGPGFFDLDTQGVNLAGAAGTDGAPQWYGWKGRRAPEYVTHAPLVAGKVVDGSTKNLLTYSVRAPEGYKSDDAQLWPVVLILHGSNSNCKDYVMTLAEVWPDIARDYILLGINGETPSGIAADALGFNYTYVNFMGRSTYKGYPGTDRESPQLVRDAMDDLRKVYPVKHYLVGGHSQGGFLTYSLLMNSPEAIAGAFPISGGVIMQCEPSVFEDEALRAAQRKVPLAIVHGENDPLVGFDSGTYGRDLFLDGGWPATHFFTSKNAGHMFAHLPVDHAIRWLESLVSDDPKVLLDFAEAQIQQSAYRDAIAALLKVGGMKLDAAASDRFNKLKQDIDDLAEGRAKKFVAAIEANENNEWVDDFLAFRDDFEHAESASATMSAFNALRAQHEPSAKKVFAAASQAFQQGRLDKRAAKSQEIVDQYYASTYYRLAKKWAVEKK